MSVSARSYMSAPLAVLTAGVVLSGAALVSAPGAQASCAGIEVDGACIGYSDVATAAVAVPSYALTQGAFLGADVAAVAADAVAVVAALPPAVVATLVSGLPLSSAWEAPSVQTVVARFSTDVAQLQTDWQDTISASNFLIYVAGLRRAPAPDPGSAAASVPSRHSRSAKPAATAHAEAAASTTRVAIVGGEPEQHVSAPTTSEQAAVVIHRGTRVSIHRGTVDSANKPQPRD
jgi:hypothetical protein